MNAIITGAASGIGQASAMALARSAQRSGKAANLLLIDYAAEKLGEVAQSLSNAGFNALPLAGDLSDPAFVDTIARKALTEFGGVDTLISNAGVIMTAPLTEMTLDEYDRMFAVNTRVTWLLAKACHPMLRESKGAIVATASISAREPTPPHGAYSASKAALVMLVKQMAFEWGPDGIRCNCVSPGMIHTGMTDQVYSDPARRSDRARHIPLRRVGSPEDVARVIAFLASEDAAYITGVDLPVDGGVLMTLMPTLRGASVPT
ncbi:MAG: SDR family oxidoreductase [Pseudomonadota bacterium]